MGESIKTSFNKGIQNFKTFVDKFNKLDDSTKPKDYVNMDDQEFDGFLNDDNFQPSPTLAKRHSSEMDKALN